MSDLIPPTPGAPGGAVRRVLVNAAEWLYPSAQQAFDQPCRHANRVGHHGVYCHSAVARFRKCFYRWDSMSAHEGNLCGGYEPNPDWTAKRPLWNSSEPP